MLSFKPFLHAADPPRENLQTAHQRMIAALLDGIVAHAVRGDSSDHSRLECDLAQIRREVASGNLDSSELMIATGTALKTLQDYNRRTGAAMQAQSAELQKITAMLTQAVVNLSVEGSTNVLRLQGLEQQLEHAAGIDDVRLLRNQLFECLTGIREERIRQRAVTDNTVDNLSAELRTVQASTAALDTITGLTTRPTGEASIAAATDGSRTTWAALFVIDHLHGLNARFGRAVGDQTVLMFAQHLVRNLKAQDAVFRWSGPAFLVLLERDETADRIGRELRPLTSARLELNVEARGRTVLLPINFSWTLMPVPLAGKASAVVDKLDAFLNSKIGESKNH